MNLREGYNLVGTTIIINLIEVHLNPGNVTPVNVTVRLMSPEIVIRKNSLIDEYKKYSVNVTPVNVTIRLMST